MRIVIFDDQSIRNFYPLTFTRSTGDLRVGILKLRQRIAAFLGSDPHDIIVNKNLQKLYNERHQDWKINEFSDDEAIYVNSRIKITEKLADQILAIPKDSSLVCDKQIIAARFCSDITESDNFLMQIERLSRIEIEAKFWNHTWEFIAENSEYIKKDFEDFFYDKDNFFETEMGVTVLDPYNIWIGDGCKIAPGVIVDASEGPVVLDENVTIMPNAVIIGPCYIGKNSKIKVAAKIYEGTTIGATCKIGGEVEESIISDFSNKQHDGFLGHSYLGEWVNLGADTNNSDLKNNYGEVKMYDYVSQKKISSGTRFLGMIMGDHSKTGINSTINTGTVIGIGCNLFGRNIISNFIPDFSWGEAENLSSYRFEKFCETATRVKQRRDKVLTDCEKELYKKISEKDFTL